jgi:hypothetical protein
MVEVNKDIDAIFPEDAPVPAEDLVKSALPGPINGVESGYVKSDVKVFNPETGNFEVPKDEDEKEAE